MFVTQDQNDTSMVLNLIRLFNLRYISIICQTVVILSVTLFLELNLPVIPLYAVLFFLLLWNVGSKIKIFHSQIASEHDFFVQLVVDVVAFATVLFFTGGATNPMAWFFLLPLTAAATVISKPYIWKMAVLTLVLYSSLMFVHIPLEVQIHSHNNGFTFHVFGMWAGFCFSVLIIAYFVAGMAHTIRRNDRALADARERAQKDKRIIELGTLAAGTAHELGTPLATMSILVEELQQETNVQEQTEKFDILHTQIIRCKQALSVLSASSGEVRADTGGLVEVDRYFKRLVNHWSRERPGVVFHQQIKGTSDPMPFVLAEQSLDHAITNILNNAADVSLNCVELEAVWDTRTVNVKIKDRGPGLDEVALKSIGNITESTKEYGLGVGLFLAHSVIHRLGGTIKQFNRDGGGVCTQIALPLTSG